MADGDSRNLDSSGFRYEFSQEAAYTPIRVLGRGAFGEAVLYRKVEDNTLVVWKEIALSRLGDKERLDSQNEIDILSILNHANIISYYNHFLDGETLLIEMEYANGGTLYSKIAHQEELFMEEEVLWFFYQLASAIAHIHEYGILHRDIKTLNIFLTKSGLVKLGDFGISKILDSKTQMARSVVGTPYYMSPELVKGEEYNQKSDIWAVGCVLYELLTLTRVFDASNPLKLAHEIVLAEFADINSKYSSSIQDLLRDLLAKEPEKRPTSEEILKYPVVTAVSSEFDARLWEMNAAARRAKKMSTVSTSTDIMPVVTSKSSEVYVWGGGKSTPQKLEIFAKGKSALQISVGHSHFAVVTVEKELFTWAVAHGGSMVGQLGHGDTAAYKAPHKVDIFEDTPINHVSCGEDFTVCVTDEGSIYSFGSDYYGCLGVEGEEGEEVCTPVLIDFFSSRPVQQVSCGDSHVVALTRNSEVYTWGCGEYGRLGLGSEDDYSSPQRVETRGKHAIRAVHAGPDGTYLLNTNGRMLACGSNECNKLGFNSSAHGLGKHKKQISYDIPCKYTFSTVKPLSKYHIVSVSAGLTHTAVIDEYGHLITFGSNKHGQLGVGDFKRRNGINLVGGALMGKCVEKVACGDSFTVIATADDQIYSCGLAENGRLGTIPSEKGKGPGGQCYALPRPIFGSLHVVSSLACRHWQTLLVAEKVLGQKTIRCSSSMAGRGMSPSYETQMSSDSVFDEGGGGGDGGGGGGDLLQADVFAQENGGSCASPGNRAGATANGSMPGWLQAELADSEYISTEPSPPHRVAESTQEQSFPQIRLPDWLQQELEDAEYIPLPGAEPVQQDQVPSVPSQPCVNNDTSHEHMQAKDDTIAKLNKTVSDLEEKVSHLQTHNDQLQELVVNQAAAIKQLEAQNYFHEDIQYEIWRLVDDWRVECDRSAQSDITSGDVNESMVSSFSSVVASSLDKMSQSLSQSSPDINNKTPKHSMSMVNIDIEKNKSRSTEELSTPKLRQGILHDRRTDAGKTRPLSVQLNGDRSFTGSLKNLRRLSCDYEGAKSNTKGSTSGNVDARPNKSGRCFVAVGNQNNQAASEQNLTDDIKAKPDRNGNTDSGNTVYNTFPRSATPAAGRVAALPVDNRRHSYTEPSSSHVVQTYTMPPVDELEARKCYKSVMHISLSLNATTSEDLV